MSDPRTDQAAAIIDALDAVSAVDICECTRPRSEHIYWEDRIYDYNGQHCPKSSFNSEYRFSASLTMARHRDARITKLASMLPPAPRETP